MFDAFADELGKIAQDKEANLLAKGMAGVAGLGRGAISAVKGGITGVKKGGPAKGLSQAVDGATMGFRGGKSNALKPVADASVSSNKRLGKDLLAGTGLIGGAAYAAAPSNKPRGYR